MYKIITSLLILVSANLWAQQPQLKGGLDAFVKTNTIYPSYSLNNCIQGTVTVGFKLSAKGEVFYSKIINAIGTDLDDEALRLIRMSSKQWQVPLNHDTTTLLIVPVNFSLQGYGCERKTKKDIALAINAYKNEESLINAISNFYKNKEKGNYSEQDEPKILAIKRELEIDDDYLTEKINQAQKKIKQGDLQGACEDFTFVKYMGSTLADKYLAQYCK